MRSKNQKNLSLLVRHLAGVLLLFWHLDIIRSQFWHFPFRSKWKLTAHAILKQRWTAPKKPLSEWRLDTVFTSWPVFPKNCKKRIQRWAWCSNWYCFVLTLMVGNYLQGAPRRLQSPESSNQQCDALKNEKGVRLVGASRAQTCDRRRKRSFQAPQPLRQPNLQWGSKSWQSWDGDQNNAEEERKIR